MNKTLYKFMLTVLAAAIAVGLSLGVSAQTKPKPAPTAKPYTPDPPVVGGPGTRAPLPAPMEHMVKYPRAGTYERSIAVAANVSLTLCVQEGNLRVNGWSRNEVRVYVENGSNFVFKVKEKGADGKPVWVQPINNVPGRANVSECVWGDAVEIDVPTNTTVTLQGKEIHAQIDTIKRISAKTVGGDINIRDVKEGVSATTYEGDITVEESWGQVALESTTGNIVVVDSGPSDIGDAFRAKTNSGAVSLTRVTHRQQEVTSISGSVFFTGDIKSGGNYSFTTNNGSLRLALPSTTGCKLAATFTPGSFKSEIPFKIETDNIVPGDLKTIVTKLGPGGDAFVKLSTAQGLIDIKKQ